MDNEVQCTQTREAWVKEQAELRTQCETTDRLDFDTHSPDFTGLRLIGGVDISYQGSDQAIVAVSVLSFPSLTTLYIHSQQTEIPAPYIPGFLGFREIPAYQKALCHLQQTHPELWPQVILVDGNGLLHPQRFGSACHLGVKVDVPTVGVAKNLLHIDGLKTNAKDLKRVFAGNPEVRQVPLVTDDLSRVVGMAVAPPGGATNPIFVSTGHRISLTTAVELVRRCSIHRVPEPIRVADLHSRAALQNAPSPEITKK
ncbi:hypothetical protein GGI07_004962 [Coemansia sp. Benny D115]|nr:hypothetical protein GGI07_004962 [Coemansia sp. Benny D115]